MQSLTREFYGKICIFLKKKFKLQIAIVYESENQIELMRLIIQCSMISLASERGLLSRRVYPAEEP